MSFHASHFRYFLPCSTSSIGQLTCFAMTLLNFERRRIMKLRLNHTSIHQSYILCPRLKIQCWKSYWPTTNTHKITSRLCSKLTNEFLIIHLLLCSLTPTFRIHLLTKTDNETLILLFLSRFVVFSRSCSTYFLSSVWHGSKSKRGIMFKNAPSKTW